MKLLLAENIRKFRRERKLTQEQLAEAMGVSVGAVSRWESGDTSPDISMVPELARFFDTSTDVLLGYALLTEGLKQNIDQIRKLRNAKRFTDAQPLTEKLLLRYPNSFDAVLCAAQFYGLKGAEQEDRKSLERALKLLERALELVGQNTNPKINSWTLRNEIANTYHMLHLTDRALDELKRNNAGGLNDARIGMLLANDKQQPDEALTYLTDALLSHTNGLIHVVTGYINAYCLKKRYRDALDLLSWMRTLTSGLMQDGKTSFHNMLLVQLDTSAACVAMEANDEALALQYLRSAKKEALVFDAAPDYGYTNVRFFHSNERPTAFTNFGDTAMEGILNALKEPGNSLELPALWERVLQEP